MMRGAFLKSAAKVEVFSAKMLHLKEEKSNFLGNKLSSVSISSTEFGEDVNKTLWHITNFKRRCKDTTNECKDVALVCIKDIFFYQITSKRAKNSYVFLNLGSLLITTCFNFT